MTRLTRADREKVASVLRFAGSVLAGALAWSVGDGRLPLLVGLGAWTVAGYVEPEELPDDGERPVHQLPRPAFLVGYTLFCSVVLFAVAFLDFRSGTVAVASMFVVLLAARPVVVWRAGRRAGPA